MFLSGERVAVNQAQYLRSWRVGERVPREIRSKGN